MASFLLTGICVVWGFASPIPSGPDETAQIVKAVGVGQGTLLGALPPPSRHPHNSTLVVRVPGTVERSLDRKCHNYRVGRPSTCHTSVRASAGLVPTSTYVGRYPPLYYALTGSPWLVSDAAGALSAMRVIAALVVGVLLGLAYAVTATWGRSGLRLLALGAVVTPTTLYFGGVVNPNGMEIAGATLLWSALAVLVFDPSDEAPLAVVVAAVAGSVTLCASRSLSTFIFALIVAATVLVRPAKSRRLWAQRRVRFGSYGALVFALASGIYVLAARSYEVQSLRLAGHYTSVGYGAAIIGHTPRFVAGVIGDFGAPNFSAPTPVLALWAAAVASLVVAAWTLATRRDAIVLAVVVAVLGFLVPFAVVYSHVRLDGLVWQGRYSLPFIAGVPLLAAGVIADRHPRVERAALARLSFLVCFGLVAGDVASFYQLLRRYTVGLREHDLNAFALVPGHWTPFLGAVPLFSILVAFTLAWGVWLRTQAVRTERADSDPIEVGRADLPDHQLDGGGDGDGHERADDAEQRAPEEGSDNGYEARHLDRRSHDPRDEDVVLE